MITCSALIQDKLKFSLVHVEHAASNEGPDHLQHPLKCSTCQ